MPNIVVSGVRGVEQVASADASCGISQAVVQDATGKLYDVFVTDTEAGKKRLAARVRAAETLGQAREPAGLGFAVDWVSAFEPGTDGHGPTGTTAVMLCPHAVGDARPLNMLTIDDCTAVGTAIGAIHRLQGGFLTDHDYPAFTTGQIRAQLTAWIKRLRQAGHIPAEITTSWSRILETEGLWSFATCPVHGGFDDGDMLFSGSTITTITNWQDMQINDPARDLAWIFAKLDESHRNAVLSAYGRMLGNRLDGLIMLRANLWLQMEQVGEFIQALKRADNTKILQFKAQVERLAHQLGVITQQSRGTDASTHADAKPPSTITVGTLLDDAERRRSAASSDMHDDTADNPVRQAGAPAVDSDDDTGETDRTGSSQIEAVGEVDIDSTADHPVTATGPAPTSPTIALQHTGDDPGLDVTDERSLADDTADHPAAPGDKDSTATMLIPLLEREERAMRDAQAGLHDTDDNTDGGMPQA